MGGRAKESPPLTEIDELEFEELEALSNIVSEEREILEEARELFEAYQKQKYLLEKILEELKPYWWFTVIPEKEEEE